MKAGIHLTKGWSDNDVVLLTIESSDGKSFFSNKAYAGHGDLDQLVQELSTFKHHVHGGVYDMNFGRFGAEYAAGAFQARLHFQPRGKILASVRAQSEFNEFGTKTVASEATLYLWTEPALLDNFIAELDALRLGKRDDAYLAGAA